MKVKAVYALCKSTRAATLINDNETQWLSNGRAIYPLINHPVISAQHVMTFMEVPEGKESQYIVEEMNITEHLSELLQDEYPTENTVMQYVSSLNGYIPLQTSKGLALIDPAYLRPLKDLPEGVTLYERVSLSSGKLYIAAKSGMFLYALIIPDEKQVTAELVDSLASMASGAKTSLRTGECAGKCR